MKKNKLSIDRIPVNLDEIVKIHQYRNFLRKAQINWMEWNTIDKVNENRLGLLDNYPTSEAVTTPISYRFL